MTAQVTAFLSRAQLGLRSPRSISRNITPQHGGSTVHYAGGDQNVSPLLSGHTRCVALWRGYQNYHMSSRGYADVAYNAGFCQHGYAFAGRGLGIRSGANGTNSGNQNFYAFCWIGGEGETPTRAALDALEWLIRDARRQGGAGRRVVPHSWHKSTGCPGGNLRPVANSLDNKDISGDAPAQGKTFEQMIVGANATDLEAGRVAATTYRWVLCLIKASGELEVVGPHPDAGKAVKGNFAIPVGSAANSRHLDQFENGVIKIQGKDRNETAREIGEMLVAHPPTSINRRGRPW